MDDLRLKVSGNIRYASTLIQYGDWKAGLKYCDSAALLGPTTYDAAALDAIRGYGLIKAGCGNEGVSLLRKAVEWYASSGLRFTQAQFTLWLANGQALCGDIMGARHSIDEVASFSAGHGYGLLERVAKHMSNALDKFCQEGGEWVCQEISEVIAQDAPALDPVG